MVYCDVNSDSQGGPLIGTRDLIPGPGLEFVLDRDLRGNIAENY